ncbi:hypothetical protein NPX13_g3721 [Xylaria arbuscula]|uniref:3-oxoacyl-[acyl-carrier-protein] reductase n=1 Tax=Xylaria arbuscula TaxID=114810 RepID=A0A9W8TPU5_9PEZI|nr:hypothetical protein NPX13_g3721 [Xylaria arbuscula]
MQTLRNKRCIITGGSRGIGLAIAQLFAKHGASCLLVARDEARLRKARASLAPIDSDSTALPHGIRTFDVSQQIKWGHLMHITKEEPLDILVNAAGISQNALLSRTELADINQILGANLRGTIFGCQSAIQKMMKQKSGSIINVSSLLATNRGRGASVYAASKAGVIGLTRALAWEVGRFNIRANVIQPGYIRTDMTKGMDKGEELSALIPLGRLGLAEEVADAALFLANNTYAHNCVLNIDGGLSAT